MSGRPIMWLVRPRIWTYSPSRARRTGLITSLPRVARSSPSQVATGQVARHPGHGMARGVRGGGRCGQAGAVLDRVQVHGAVHDHAVARSLSVIHGQGTECHLLVLVQVHGIEVHDVARDRMVARLRHGLLAVGLLEIGGEDVAGLVAHRHEGDVVGAGRHLSTGIHRRIILRTHLGSGVHREGGRTERHRGEQSRDKEHGLH